MANVDLNDLVKKFDDVTAVDGISLEIPDESFTVLVGPSGCGKTTTLRLIAGLERATDGEIRIGETMVNDSRAYERDIAMVFQNYALYPHKTVQENMRFGLEQHDTEEDVIQERVEDAAELLQIQELLDRRPAELSGGQQQRVALGRAIVRDPAVFLMDEPLSNLDAKLRVQMRAELNKLHEKLSTTTVYVTHDQVEAMTLADQIAVMDDGQIQQVGAPTRVYRNPRNMFVAGFLGSPSMNFIEGNLEEAKTGNLQMDLGAHTHNIPDEYADRLRDRLGEEVILGIRPENVSLSESGVAANVHPGVVSVVEPQGEKTVLEVELETGQTIKAAIAPDMAVETGDEVNLRFDRDSLHYFDPESGTSIIYDLKTTPKVTP
ncbi:multiple sugar transport system ATP-binding protein [Halohasta litchfieldiae]|jgi:multiple sugar transport system ATP-binding protein|uniref:ABC-type D-xylose/L-arabinose transporter n=1 Tax=Halohasta litchfieldiae TaxID=1073996 RepID=A0A1H6S7P8_9EURY|nr:ABC transporter ATP-binding protein [Halohasta litchfieldiae]ATW87891.1 multiple sugar transport system ATP-binding protein [Halohasta litchfieldiae]SEI62796.1 carbohydrate ABC transporter ATP-binding protein, CUT1 family [Halohasta litchfieldiae]